MTAMSHLHRFIVIGLCMLVVVLLANSCGEVTDELHLTGRQAGPADFEAACAPAKAVFWAEDGTLGLSYNVRCSDGRFVKVDDRLPGGGS